MYANLLLIIIMTCSIIIYYTTGWCYIKWVNGSREGPMGMRRNVIPPVFGYELWLYLTFIVLPLLYIWIRCYIRVKVCSYLQYGVAGNF